MKLTPKQLDAQCTVFISRWVDIDSDEIKRIDDDLEFTKRCLRMGLQEPPFFFLDSDGRVFGRDSKDPTKPYYPFHFEYKSQLIGVRVSKRAAN